MNLAWLRQCLLGGLRRIPGATAVSVDTGPKAQPRLDVTAGQLDALLSGRTQMIVCRQAIPAAVCEQLSSRFLALSEEEGFREWRLGDATSDFSKLGYTKTDAMREGTRMAAGRAAPKLYLDRAARSRHLLAELSAPRGSLVKDLASELNALPGFACRAERCPESRREFLPCVVRSMAAGGRRQGGNVHMDSHVPGRVLSLNIYLQVPVDASGGDVVLYPVRKDLWHRFVNSHFFSTIDVQNYFPDREFYTSEWLRDVEPLVHRPAAGDVVILDPAYPHAVRDFEASSSFRRLSMQTFMQVSSDGRARVLEYAV